MTEVNEANINICYRQTSSLFQRSAIENSKKEKLNAGEHVQGTLLLNSPIRYRSQIQFSETQRVGHILVIVKLYQFRARVKVTKARKLNNIF